MNNTENKPLMSDTVFAGLLIFMGFAAGAGLGIIGTLLVLQ
jgi:hypothetical protein